MLIRHVVTTAVGENGGSIAYEATLTYKDGKYFLVTNYDGDSTERTTSDYDEVLDALHGFLNHAALMATIV